MERKEIQENVISILVTVGELESAEEITEDSFLIEDLGISSMQSLLIGTYLEQKFQISLPGKVIRRCATVEDLIDAVEERIG